MQLPDQELLTPGEVAKLFRVSPKTVARWSRQGTLAEIRTAGGHRRFRKEDVEVLWEKANPGR
jgi:excisionase family DNA binding protein